MQDPPRPEVIGAVAECHTAGIRIIMITGDYGLTAEAIARKIGIITTPEARVITGAMLDEMTEQDLKDVIGGEVVFARVVPEHKMLIAQTLQSMHEVVAMTGDGVNDAPALKSAHIGIAMGKRGTDVAREASSIVLVDDNFAAIVNGVKIGRRIYDNLRKAMTYIFAVHLPIAGLSLLPLFFNWPLILLPVHIVFLEMVIDPACTVAFEAEKAEPNTMQRPPRKLKEPIFNKKMILISLLQGGSSLIFLAIIFAISMQLGIGIDKARAITFMAMVGSNLSLILTNRSWSLSIIAHGRGASNKPVYWIIFLALSLLILVNYLPFLTSLFKFTQLSFLELILAIVGGFAIVIWFELLKVLKLVRA
jgi:Ca2+-transporting ATPase